MLDEHGTLSSNSAGRRDLCLPEESDHADTEFLSFAEQNLSQLIKIEEARLKTPSSLRVFARLDIGIWRDASGVLSYFVNEVERGPSTFLWSRQDSWIPGRIGPVFGKSLRAWLDMYHVPQPLP
jgi:hypothetical protein